MRSSLSKWGLYKLRTSSSWTKFYPLAKELRNFNQNMRKLHFCGIGYSLHTCTVRLCKLVPLLEKCKFLFDNCKITSEWKKYIFDSFCMCRCKSHRTMQGLSWCFIYSFIILGEKINICYLYSSKLILHDVLKEIIILFPYIRFR